MNRQKWKIALTQRMPLKHSLKEAFPAARFESEQYCDYRLNIPTIQKQNIIAKQYDNGTFYAEGPVSKEWELVCKIVNQKGSHIAPSPSKPSQSEPSIKMALNESTHSYIGQDESGKGDYFGGPVVAGIYLSPQQVKTLKDIGVQDSKNLSAVQIRSAAKKIKEIVPENAIEIISTPPNVYNALYETFTNQRKNLNNLLGHLHATVLTRLLDRHPECEYAIIDQFGKLTDVSDYLKTMAKLNLIQEPRAERYTAVAAASILARNEFVQQINTLEEKYQYRFPLGAGQDVISAARIFLRQHGKPALRDVAKLHFKTTDSL